jgi:hypothetical protein
MQLLERKHAVSDLALWLKAAVHRIDYPGVKSS